MFQLVFKGECAPGTELQAAKDSARALFKANVDQIERMFSGQTVVIRNKLEEVQAEKYRAVLKKHGMLAYVEPMEGTVANTPPPSAAQKQAPAAQPAAETARQDGPPSTASAAKRTEPEAGKGVEVEPGDRLPVAGEKVDSILSGSGLTLDPVGVTLEEHREHEAPLFEHLDDWTLAPPGTELVEEKDAPPPMVPDVSHLSLADDDRKNDR